jgi:hypothetical protein
MPLAKKEWVISGAVANTFGDSRIATVLDHETTLFFIENVGRNSGGGGSGAVYSVMATANREDSLIDWFTIYSGNTLNSGDVQVHKIDKDPWDAVKFQTMNVSSGYVASVKAYINRK